MDPSKNLEWKVSNGNLEEVRKIITKYGISHRPEWCNGYTLLRAAIKNGETEVALFLLGSGCNVKSKRSLTVPTKTVVHLAVLNCNLEILKAILDKGAYVNVTDKDGRTPLHEAVKRQESPWENYESSHSAILRRYDSTKDFKITKDNWQDIRKAVERKMAATTVTQEEHREFVKVILDKGADVNIADKDGNTPLHEAVKREYVDTTVLLVEYGANVNTRNKNGEMPLHVALEKGLIRNAEHLVEHGADVNSVWTNYSKSGYTPLQCAAENGYERIVKILLDKGAHVNVTNENGNAPLHEAVKRSHEGTTELLLDFGANVNARNKNGEMPLHIASDKGLIRNAEHLLQHGADVNSVLTKKSKNGYTSLHIATENGYDGIVDLLLSNGARADVKGKGWTPLHLAAKQGHENIIRNLLKHGADVNCMCTANSSEGYSPLHFAVRKGHVSAARILLECGANVDAQDKLGDTILFVAVVAAKISMVEMVLQYRPNVNNESNRSSLNYALHGFPSQHREIVFILLENGFNIRDEADVNVVSRLNTTPSINGAAANGYDTVLEELLQQGASANFKDVYGQTPLNLAANGFHIHEIEILLKYGADINSRDQWGSTALHKAARMGLPYNVQRLLDNGSDVNITDRRRRTAIDVATLAQIENGGPRDPNITCIIEMDHYGHIQSFHGVMDILEKHIIKLKISNLPVSQKNLRSIKYNQILRDFEEECKVEFETLRGTLVGNTNHSFFHLLTKSVHRLAIILEDDSVFSCVTLDHVKEKFPLYGTILSGHLTLAKRRKKILDETSACVYQIFPNLNWDCIQKIITYLSNGDLMNIMHACKRKPTTL